MAYGRAPYRTEKNDPAKLPNPTLTGTKRTLKTAYIRIKTQLAKDVKNSPKALILLDILAFLWYNFYMKIVFTQEQLNTIPHEVLTSMYLALASNFEALQSQMNIVQTVSG